MTPKRQLLQVKTYRVIIRKESGRKIKELKIWQIPPVWGYLHCIPVAVDQQFHRFLTCPH